MSVLGVHKIWPDSSFIFNRELRITDHYLRPLSESYIIIIIICSSYIALFLAEASSKRFTYYINI